MANTTNPWTEAKERAVVKALVSGPKDTNILVTTVKGTYGKGTGGLTKGVWTDHTTRSILTKAQNIVVQANAMGRALHMPPSPPRPKKVSKSDKLKVLLAELPMLSAEDQKKIKKAANDRLKRREAGVAKAKTSRAATRAKPKS